MYILFTYNGRFLKNSKRLLDQARKAMLSVLRKSKKLFLPVDIQLQLFDSMVAPILLYGSEVSGFETSNVLESLCLQFYKYILEAKKTTSNIILYGELGRYTVEILIKSRMIGFWQRIINGKVDKISYKLYNIILNMKLFYSKWLAAVKSILTDSGFEQLCINQDNIPMAISKKGKFNLIEKYKASWKHLIFETLNVLIIGFSNTN